MSFSFPSLDDLFFSSTDPAKIIKLASEHKVAVQESISLHCQAEGNPQPSYTWTPCGPQQNTCHESVLDISEVLNDIDYTCNVTNVLGSDSKRTSLGKLVPDIMCVIAYRKLTHVSPSGHRPICLLTEKLFRLSVLPDISPPLISFYTNLLTSLQLTLHLK